MFAHLARGLLAALILAAPVAAHDYKIADLSVAHPAIPQPATRAMTAAGHFSVTNSGTTPDRLLAVEAGISARVEMHTTDHGSDGTAKMRHVEAVDLPAGETVDFTSGSWHVMFMGLSGGLEPGAKVPGVLVFEKAGRLDVVFNVEAPEAPAKDAHAHH